MKITLIFRDGIESRYIASKILKVEKNVQIIFETGKIAKLKKIKRTFPLRKIYLWPKRFLDLASLQIYESLFKKYLRSKILNVKITNFIKVDDVNEETCINHLIKYKPDIIIIFGTAIIREPFLSKVKKPIYNIHTGILPKYRNVHSEFWAYKNKDFENIGVSIIRLEKGVDSGDIALQRTVSYRKNDTLFSLRLKTFKLILPILKELLIAHKKKHVSLKKQDNKQAIYFQTPNAINLLQYIYQELKPATR